MVEPDRRRSVCCYWCILLCSDVFVKLNISMETKKENKKGFWASLFSPKPCSCSCSCGDNLVRNEEVKAEEVKPEEKKEEEKKDETVPKEEVKEDSSKEEEKTQ